MTRSEAEGLLDPFGLKENGVKKAFRKAALYWHPDKGGDAEMFAKMVEARDVLLEKENIWDAFAYMKPEGPFAGPFGQHFRAPSSHSYKNFWRENYEQRKKEESQQAQARGRNTWNTRNATQEGAERLREYLRGYGKTGKFTFMLNGEKFDIFV